MKSRRTRLLVVVILILHQSGCGTIFYPERRGQPAGPLDLKVVALDAIGLLFFFIPGVIAFAVDFNNGTIYLPQGSYQPQVSQAKAVDSVEGWKCVRTASTHPDAAEIEQIVRRHTGRNISLKPGSYRATKLDSLAALENVNLNDQDLAVACEYKDVYFRCQSE